MRQTSIASIESLENRQLLSGVTLHELRGVQFTADLGTFIALAPATGLKSTISWGDGTTSTGVIKADIVAGAAQSHFELDGTHTYKNAGTYAIDATVYRPGPAPTTYEILVTRFSDTAIVGRGATSLTGKIAGKYLAAPVGPIVPVVPVFPVFPDIGATYVLFGFTMNNARKFGAC